MGNHGTSCIGKPTCVFVLALGEQNDKQQRNQNGNRRETQDGDRWSDVVCDGDGNRIGHLHHGKFHVICCGVLGGGSGYLGTLWDSCTLWGPFLGRAGGKAAQARRHLHLHQGGDWGGSSLSLHNVQGSLAQPMQPGSPGACRSSVSCCSSLPLLSS